MARRSRRGGEQSWRQMLGQRVQLTSKRSRVALNFPVAFQKIVISKVPHISCCGIPFFSNIHEIHYFVTSSPNNGGGALSDDLCDAGARVSRRATATFAHAHAAREAANMPVPSCTSHRASTSACEHKSTVHTRMRSCQGVKLHYADHARAGCGMSRIPDPYCRQLR